MPDSARNLAIWPIPLSQIEDTGGAGPVHLAFISLFHRARTSMRAAVWTGRTCKSARKLRIHPAPKVSRKAGWVARSRSSALARVPGKDQRGRNRFVGRQGKRCSDKRGFKCLPLLNKC
jgi:hypothetical protein